MFVLLRYQRDEQLLSRTQALAWLHAQDQVGRARADALREVGDGCLLIAGLFPGVAERRRVQRVADRAASAAATRLPAARPMVAKLSGVSGVAHSRITATAP